MSSCRYHEIYEDMAARNPDFAFPNLVFAFKYIPMSLNADEHRVARRRIAEFIAARKSAISALVPEMVDRQVDPFAQRRERQEIEVMAELVEPLTREFLAALSGANAVPSQGIGAIFVRMLGARRRRKLDNEIGMLRTHIRDALGADGTEDEEGVRLALAILGHDALTGSMGESLHQLFRQNPGIPLTKIDFPTVPNETGVAFAERIVEQPFDFDGTSFRLGDRIRIMLQSFAYSSDAATRTRMFGAGLHTCLGRQLSLELWSALARRLSQIRARVDILDYRSVDEDYVSTCPSRLLIALRP
jgi:hypothetical protein